MKKCDLVDINILSYDIVFIQWWVEGVGGEAGERQGEECCHISPNDAYDEIR